MKRSSLPLAAAILLTIAPTLSRAECFLVPTDPADCSLVDSARVFVETAKTEITSAYKDAKGEISQEAVRCYTGAMNYLMACAKANCEQFSETMKKLRAANNIWTDELKAEYAKLGAKFKSEECGCRDFAITLTRPIGSGWTIEESADFTGQPGSCVFKQDSNKVAGFITSPTGENVASVLRKVVNGKITEERFLLKSDTTCKRAGGEKTGRKFSLSQKGVLIIDWGDEGKVSRNWGKNVAMVGEQGFPALSATDESTARFTWPNGAYLELGADGTPKDSNILESSNWDANVCETKSEDGGKHIFPNVKVKGPSKGAKPIAKLAKDPVKN